MRVAKRKTTQAPNRQSLKNQIKEHHQANPLHKSQNSVSDKDFATARSRDCPLLGVQGLKHGTSNIVLGYPIGEKGDFF